MERYKITTATTVHENLSWNRVCDIILISDDGSVWHAFFGLEDHGVYEFMDSYGNLMILERM